MSLYSIKSNCGSFFWRPVLTSAISLLCLCVTSPGSSWVLNVPQVSRWKQHSWLLRCHNNFWRSMRESSIWIQSLASACHLVSQNRSYWMLKLWTGGIRPSNTGMEHCSGICWVLPAYMELLVIYLENLLKKHAGCWLVSVTSGGKSSYPWFYLVNSGPPGHLCNSGLGNLH